MYICISICVISREYVSETVPETINVQLNTSNNQKKGKIKAVKKGKCVIYVCTQNGIYKTIKVTVK